MSNFPSKFTTNNRKRRRTDGWETNAHLRSTRPNNSHDHFYAFPSFALFLPLVEFTSLSLISIEIRKMTMTTTIKGTKAGKASGVSTSRINDLTLSAVATRLLVEQNQLGGTVSGYFASGVMPRMVLDPAAGTAEVIRAVALKPAYNLYDPLCPRNFGAVVDSAKKMQDVAGLTLPVAFQYYTKSKLAYSCVTSGGQLLEAVVPALEQELGVTQLPVGDLLYAAAKDSGTQTINATTMISLKDFEHFELDYIPNQRHSLMIMTGEGIESWNHQTIEDYQGGNEFASHYILQCRSTGIVLDLSLGQLNGVMRPAIFASYNDYEAAFPGRILKKHHSEPLSDLIFQTMLHVSPDFCPPRFGTRVVHHLQAQTPFCALCLGVASHNDIPNSSSSSSGLKCCSACKQVFYCSKTCQKLHWKEHKHVCGGRTGKAKATASEP